MTEFEYTELAWKTNGSVYRVEERAFGKIVQVKTPRDADGTKFSRPVYLVFDREERMVYCEKDRTGGVEAFKKLKREYEAGHGQG